MPVRNQVQLITYPDSLGGGLPALASLLEGPLAGLFPAGVHVLPPFPSSGDRGFAPLTYDEIEPSFGTWDDLRRITASAPVMLDLMVNHMSRQAGPVKDFLARGEASPHADLFITPGKVWPGGTPPAEDLARLFLRRPSPFSRYRLADGRDVELWTTFGKQDPSEQVDLDRRSPAYAAFVTKALDGFAARGITLLRLDAVGYVVKKPGTSCFFVEPGIWEYLAWIRKLADARGIELLPEVHAAPAIQRALAARGYWTYDFILPYRILEALITGDAADLRAYLAGRSSRQFTMLDCHDGIPVKPDLDGLYDPPRVRRVVDTCLERGANLSRIVSPAHRDPDGFDVHQVRCTYASALGGVDDAVVAARALQLFTPGIPQVYYAGLLAALNDQDAARRTGDGREVNRPNYTATDVLRGLEKPVVQRIVSLLRLRNTHPAFNGSFAVEQVRTGALRLAWTSAEGRCALEVDLRTAVSVVEQSTRMGAARTEQV